MDVEGHEVEILDSMFHSISKNLYRPKILFETHQSRYLENHNLKKILKNYYKNGYIASIVGTSKISGSRLLQQKGYRKEVTIFSDGCERGIFYNIGFNDLNEMIHETGGIRSVLLEPINV